MQGKLPNYFRKYRKRHGISPKQMARLLGKDHYYVCRIENGKCKPTLETVIAYDLLFGVKAIELMPKFCRDQQKLLIDRITAQPHLVSDGRSLLSIRQKLNRGTCKGSGKQNVMKDEVEKTQRVLSIYPTKDGFAFSYFESPRQLVDWGNCHPKPDEINEKLQSLVDNFRPDILVTENNSGPAYQRGQRIALVLDDIYQLAEQNEIPVKKYSRAMVKGVFCVFEANNKYETAKLLSSWFPGLTKLPPEPKL
jgi:transcriptional regulator with XRE-family HTH domain